MLEKIKWLISSFWCQHDQTVKIREGEYRRRGSSLASGAVLGGYEIVRCKQCGSVCERPTWGHK